MNLLGGCILRPVSFLNQSHLETTGGLKLRRQVVSKCYRRWSQTETLTHTGNSLIEHTHGTHTQREPFFWWIAYAS